MNNCEGDNLNYGKEYRNEIVQLSFLSSCLKAKRMGFK